MTYYKNSITQTRTLTVLINADTAEQAEAIWADSSSSIPHYIDEEYPSEFWDTETEEGMRGETAIYQLPLQLSSQVNKLITYLKSQGYSIDKWRSWSTKENDLFLSITAGHQINMDDEIPAYLDAAKRKRRSL